MSNMAKLEKLPHRIIYRGHYWTRRTTPAVGFATKAQAQANADAFMGRAKNIRTILRQFHARTSMYDKGSRRWFVFYRTAA